MKRNQITDPSELEFGNNFRTLAADFARNGSVPSSVKPYTGNDQWTYLSKNEIQTRQLYKKVCDLYDRIDLYLNTDEHGAFKCLKIYWYFQDSITLCQWFGI